MGAPCINDTCSISSQVDPVTRRLQMEVNLYGEGGLTCVDGEGVQLKILGDPGPVAAIDACFQQLGVDTLGNAWSIPKRAKIHTFSGSVVNIPQGGDEGDPSSDSISSGGTLVNPYSCQAMVLVVGRYEVGYTIFDGAPGSNPLITSSAPNAGDWIPFNADIKTRIAFNGVNKNVAYMDVGGIVKQSTLNNSNKRRWQDFAFYTTIGGSSSVTIEAFANHEGSGEAINISTVNPADPAYGDPFPDRGFRAYGNAIIMPFNAEVTP